MYWSQHGLLNLVATHKYLFSSKCKNHIFHGSMTHKLSIWIGVSVNILILHTYSIGKRGVLFNFCGTYFPNLYDRKNSSTGLIILLWGGKWINIGKVGRQFFGGVGFELRALCLQSRHSTVWATPSVHFGVVILEMGGSHEIFVQADFQLLSSQSQPPKVLTHAKQ
jgi:hypothetical protein